MQLQLDPPSTDPRIKAAIIVRLMRSLETDLPLATLPRDSQKLLARAIGKMGSVDRATVDAAVQEFTQAVDEVALPAPRGVGAALDTLDGQLSPEVADEMAEEVARQDPNHAWVRLSRLPERVLARILQTESIEIAALLLSKLPVEQAAKVLTTVPGERARRIACTTPQIDKMSVAAVSQIGLALASDHCNRPDKAFETDAVGRVGAILNSTPSLRREEVLTGMEDDDPEFAEKVRRAIFTFANIAQRINPLDVPKIIRTLDQEQLQIALSGGLNSTPEDVASAEFILENMSKRMSSQLRDEIAASSPPKAAIVEEIQGLLISSIKDAIASGDITQREDDDEES